MIKHHVSENRSAHFFLAQTIGRQHLCVSFEEFNNAASQKNHEMVGSKVPYAEVAREHSNGSSAHPY